jgi:hypothetical protein
VVIGRILSLRVPAARAIRRSAAQGALRFTVLALCAAVLCRRSCSLHTGEESRGNTTMANTQDELSSSDFTNEDWSQLTPDVLREVRRARAAPRPRGSTDPTSPPRRPRAQVAVHLSAERVVDLMQTCSSWSCPSARPPARRPPPAARRAVQRADAPRARRRAALSGPSSSRLWTKLAERDFEHAANAQELGALFAQAVHGPGAAPPAGGDAAREYAACRAAFGADPAAFREVARALRLIFSAVRSLDARGLTAAPPGNPLAERLPHLVPHPDSTRFSAARLIGTLTRGASEELLRRSAPRPAPPRPAWAPAPARCAG